MRRTADGKIHDLAAGIEMAMNHVVAQMSTWLPTSDFCRFNAAPAGTWQELPHDFLTVLDYALGVSAGSHGSLEQGRGGGTLREGPCRNAATWRREWDSNPR